MIASEAFREAFRQNTPRSQAGHALKDLRLQGRIFENRCSYMIFSESFAALPVQLRDRILDRLRAVLRGDDPRGRYTYLERDEKQRIHDILTVTLPAAKARWSDFSAGEGSR